MTRFAFLVCMALSPLSLLPMLLLSRLPTVMTKFSFRVSHTMLLWFCVMVMLRFLSRVPVFLALPFLLPLPFHCSSSTCRAGWRPWPMHSWVCFIPICFFFFLAHAMEKKWCLADIWYCGRPISRHKHRFRLWPKIAYTEVLVYTLWEGSGWERQGRLQRCRTWPDMYQGSYWCCGYQGST
jgi:hypothetical protein